MRHVDTDLLTSLEAAERAGVSVRTIHRWVEDERLTPIRKLPGRLGGYLFVAEQVDQAKVAS